VKGEYWKWKGKSKSSYSTSTTQQPSRITFKLKTRGRCFNCLAKGHQVASCRDPPTCWKCKGSDHVSYRCSRKVFERSHYRSVHSLMNQRSLQRRVSNWIDGRNRNRDPQSNRGRNRNWYRGDSSRGRNRDCIDLSLPPNQDSPSPDERRALRQLWQYRGSNILDGNIDSTDLIAHAGGITRPGMHGASDAIVIIPQPSAFAQGPQLLGPNATHHNEGAPDIIVITPTVNYECQDPIHTRSEQGRADIPRQLLRRPMGFFQRVGSRL
jgi:hypothetical protein